MRARALAALVALAALAPARADDGGRPWYAPDHAKLQLAGNVGFLSPGAGWRLGDRLEADAFLGWVPEAVGGADIFSATGKLTFAPWTVSLDRRWRLRPLTAAFQLSYTFGEQYVLVPEELFPPSAVRTGFGVGAELLRRVGKGALGLYAEAVVLDVGLSYWLSDFSAVAADDVFSLAIGARYAF